MSQLSEKECQVETPRSSQTDVKLRITPPYEIFRLIIEAMVDNALAVTPKANWCLDRYTLTPARLCISVGSTKYWRIDLEKHKRRYALFGSATQINRDSRRIVEDSFPRFPVRGDWTPHVDVRFAWVCPDIDVFHTPGFSTIHSYSGPPEDYTNDQHGRRANFEAVCALRELYRNPKPAVAALLQHVRIVNIFGSINDLLLGITGYAPQIPCIESLPALEVVQALHGGLRFPVPPKNSEDRHRHGEVIPIDEAMYPYAASVAERYPFELGDLWGRLIRRGVRFEMTGYVGEEKQDMTARNELVQTTEGLQIRFTDQECHCYLDPVETERKQTMDEMGFGSSWDAWLPWDMSSNIFIWSLERYAQ